MIEDSNRFTRKNRDDVIKKINLELAKEELDRALELAEGLDLRIMGAIRVRRARWSLLTGRSADQDRIRAREILTRLGDRMELDTLTVVDALALGRKGDVAGGLALLDMFDEATEPRLRFLVAEARGVLSGLRGSHDEP